MRIHGNCNNITIKLLLYSYLNIKEDIKVTLSERFALEIVACYNYLKREKREFTMSKQILRSGTSIGANIAESIYAESPNDFIHKLMISQKGASETKYWLKLLYKAGYLPEAYYKSLLIQCNSLMNILASIILSMKNKANKET